MKCSDDEEDRKVQPQEDDEQDVLMPGFRFHPTEEELVEFYLRRKVEGKPFNVELITFLDLYRYDPWELPGLAAIGEKEWYFYVPRGRKYKNGDRPNRVTKSGYWKATGADRSIRYEDNLMPIGLKKTLVFYWGKAPRGIRTGWIMNEYRLPLHHTQTLRQKNGAEIALCRIYKRPGVTPSPRALQQQPSENTYNSCMMQQRFVHSSSSNSSSSAAATAYGGSSSLNPTGMIIAPAPTSVGFKEHDSMMFLQSKQVTNSNAALHGISSNAVYDDHLHKLVLNCYNVIADNPHGPAGYASNRHVTSTFLHQPHTQTTPHDHIIAPTSTLLPADTLMHVGFMEHNI